MDMSNNFPGRTFRVENVAFIYDEQIFFYILSEIRHDEMKLFSVCRRKCQEQWRRLQPQMSQT